MERHTYWNVPADLKVTEDHVKNAKSHIPVSCRSCGNEWRPTVASHINEKSECQNVGNPREN